MVFSPDPLYNKIHKEIVLWGQKQIGRLHNEEENFSSSNGSNHGIQPCSMRLL